MGKEISYMIASYGRSNYPVTYYNEYTDKFLKLWGINPIEMNIPSECLLTCATGKLLTLNETTKIIEDFMAKND